MVAMIQGTRRKNWEYFDYKVLALSVKQIIYENGLGLVANVYLQTLGKKIKK